MLIAGNRPYEQQLLRCSSSAPQMMRLRPHTANLAVISCDTIDHHGGGGGKRDPTPDPPAANNATDPQEPPEQPQQLDMRREEDRLKTFDSTWSVAFIDRERLARSGFYYYGDADKVRCHFCRVEIGNWEEGDDPAVDHERWSPLCPLLRGRAFSNVPLASSSSSSQSDPESAGRDECGLLDDRSPNGPVKPAFSLETARLQSFAEWPCRMKQTAEAMADAGFYYAGSGDKTICYYCGGGLKDWEDDDDPWEQHARWFPSCHYIKVVKGEAYIRQVNAKCSTPPEKAFDGGQSSGGGGDVCVVGTPPDSDAKSESDLCKLCYAGEKNICFVPCGHVVACPKCALSLQICPVCRQQFTSTMRLYYS